MDTTVEQIGAAVVAELRAADYMESTISQYEKSIGALSAFVDGHGGAYTPSLGAVFASMTISPRTGRFSAQRRFGYSRLVGLFDAYVTTGRVDLAPRTRGGGGARPQSSESAGLLVSWEMDMEDRDLAPATRDAYGRVAQAYLVFLEAQGSCCLDAADGASVLCFFESLLDRWAVSSLPWVISNFRPFLKFSGRSDLVDALSLLGAKRSHGILPVLSDKDQELVVQACASGVVSARDAAITLLALTTGLRACDIAGLRLGDIDWHAKTIGIIQQKTKNPLTLPLASLVAARLAEYILDERHDSGDDHVFLRSKAPYRPFTTSSSISYIVDRALRRAGIENPPSKGASLLRHSAATTMLRAGATLEAVGAVLRHRSLDMTAHYAKVDIKMLETISQPWPGEA